MRVVARHLYVESDGQLFLVRREGRLALPTPEEVPFEVDERVAMNLEGADVTFSVPRDHRFRADWIPKDRVPGLLDVDPLVQRAVNATLVREVSAGMVVDDEEILLVKANRGFTKGMWNVPGGFVMHGETPEQGVVRELAEEVGLEVRVERLVAVLTRRFQSPYFMRAHVFLCRAGSRELTLDPDEIAEAQWMHLDTARKMTRNPFALEALDAVDPRGRGRR